MTPEEERLKDAAELAAATGIDMTEMGQGMTSIHELYNEAKRVGFNRFQAMWLAGCALTGNPGSPPG